MPDRWITAAKALLYAVEARYEEEGVPLPQRRYVAPARPAVDCEQVTVHLVSTYSYDGRVTEEVTAPAGDRSLETLGLRAATFALAVVRHVPTIDDGGIPTVGAETAAGTLVMADAELLVAAVVSIPTCNSLSVGRWVSIPAQGGYAGGELAVTMGV